MGTLAAIVGLRAWRGALFTANIHVCYLAVFYLLLATNLARSSLDVVALVVSLSLYQSYGFLVNDYFDLPYDKMVGKDHGLGKLQRWQIITLLITLVASNAVLLSVVEHDSIFTALFLIAYLLATLYSGPPARFKARGILGFICDATIEKTLPVLLAFSFFQRYQLDAFLFVVLTEGLQLNTVLEQQIDDCEADARVGTRTFVVGIGKETAQKMLYNLFYPLNAISIVLLTATVALYAPTACNAVAIAVIVLALGLFALCASKRKDPIAHERAEQKFVGLARLLYNSSQMPMGIAYLNAGIEGPITFFLGIYVVFECFAYLPLVLLFAGSLYYYSGMYASLLVHLVALTARA